MLLTTKIIIIYQEFRRCFKNSKYELKVNERNLQTINRFEKIVLENSVEVAVNEDFILEYLLFQFEFWSGVKARAFVSNIPLIHQCFGEKAYERWSKRRRNWRYWAVKNIKEPNGIDFDLIKNKLKGESQPKDFVKITDLEEKEKQVFFNKKIGFLHCCNFTTLYNSKSAWCVKCKNKIVCRTLLKEEYKGIYAQRIKL